jgi:tetratricopeptide (TPR) repeat protein
LAIAAHTTATAASSGDSWSASSAALQLHAHERLWVEPAGWAAELADQLSPDDAAVAVVWAAIANDDAHRRRFDRAVALADRALALDPTGRAARIALEARSDVGLYRGDHAAVIRDAQMLARLSAAAGDPHGAVTAGINQALALAWSGRPHDGLAVLQALPTSAAIRDLGGVDALPPSRQGWIAYTTGEIQAVLGEASAAAAALRAAVQAADAGGSLLLAGVARVAWTAAVAEGPDPSAALVELGRAIASWRSQGDRTHLLTALRNLVPLLLRLGETSAAGVLLGAVGEGAHGMEAEKLAAAAARLDADVVASGRGMPLDVATDVALEAVTRLHPHEIPT